MKGSKRALQSEVEPSSKRGAAAASSGVAKTNSFSIFVDEKFATAGSENLQQKENQIPKSAIPKAAPAKPAISSSSVRQPLTQHAAVVPPAAPPVDSENRKPEAIAYKIQLLTAADGSEQCFEEQRSVAHLARMQRQHQSVRSFGLQKQPQQQAPPTATQQRQNSLVAQAMRDDPSSESDRESDRDEHSGNATGLDLNSTMTINTRAALATVMGMWNSPLDINQKKSVIVGGQPQVQQQMTTATSGSGGSSLNSSGSAHSSGNITDAVNAAFGGENFKSSSATVMPKNAVGQQNIISSAPMLIAQQTQLAPQATPSRLPLHSIPASLPTATPSRLNNGAAPQSAAAVAVQQMVLPNNAAAIITTPSRREPLAPISNPSSITTPAKTMLGAFHPFEYQKFEQWIPATLRSSLPIIDQSSKAAPSIPSDIIPDMPPQLQMKGHILSVQAKVSSHVYKVTRIDEDADPNKDLSDSSLYYLKVSPHSLVWELYIANQIAKRIPSQMANRYARHVQLTQFRDSANFLLESCVDPQPNLADLIAIYGKIKPKEHQKATVKDMEEHVALFYSAELLRAVEELHKCGIIHGNINPRHVVILHDPVDTWDNWKIGGWPSRGVVLVDFSTSIDMTLFPKGHCFSALPAASSMPIHHQILSCANQSVAWNYHLDYISMVQTMYFMLYGAELTSVSFDHHSKMFKANSGKRSLENPVVWERVFDTLLNVRNADVSVLSDLRTQVETALQNGKGSQVKKSLSRQKILIFEMNVNE